MFLIPASKNGFKENIVCVFLHEETFLQCVCVCGHIFHRWRRYKCLPSKVGVKNPFAWCFCVCPGAFTEKIFLGACREQLHSGWLSGSGRDKRRLIQPGSKLLKYGRDDSYKPRNQKGHSLVQMISLQMEGENRITCAPLSPMFVQCLYRALVF